MERPLLRLLPRREEEPLPVGVAVGQIRHQVLLQHLARRRGEGDGHHGTAVGRVVPDLPRGLFALPPVPAAAQGTRDPQRAHDDHQGQDHCQQQRERPHGYFTGTVVPAPGA